MQEGVAIVVQMHAMIVIVILALIMELPPTFCAQSQQIAQAIILADISHMDLPVTGAGTFS